MTAKFFTSVPHGGCLVNRVVDDACTDDLLREAETLPKVVLNSLHLADLDMIACGALSPLTGFQRRADYFSVLSCMRLANRLPWSIPIVLDVKGDVAAGLRANSRIALADDAGRTVAVMDLEEIYPRDKRTEMRQVFGTEDTQHPGVARVCAGGDVLLAGPVQAVARRKIASFPHLHLDPAQTRAEFERRGWRSVVGFQTRNPIHRAHEYLQKCALEIVDGLLIHPLVGATKEGDVPADVRVRCYEELLRLYYPGNRVVLSVFPATMRYAGPKEAIFHAICRKNYGCTHFIVGRDHAGVGMYYGTYDAQKIFNEFEPGELGITAINFEHAFFCRDCGGMASNKTCPHPAASHVFLSGTKVRELLSRGEYPPKEFTRPEIAAILISAYRADS